jgi:hypothetical protein
LAWNEKYSIPVMQRLSYISHATHTKPSHDIQCPSTNPVILNIVIRTPDVDSGFAHEYELGTHSMSTLIYARELLWLLLTVYYIKLLMKTVC